MGNFLKVWWHCLIRMFFLTGPNHRMCYIKINNMRKSRYCSCGYLQSPFAKVADEIMATVHGLSVKKRS